jgi:hypothetical protein
MPHRLSEEYLEQAERDGVDISLLKKRRSDEEWEIIEECDKKGQVK